MRVEDRYLPEPYPAWTAIGVVELAVPDGLVEVRATARRKGASSGAKPAPRAAKKASAKKSARKRTARRKA